MMKMFFIIVAVIEAFAVLNYIQYFFKAQIPRLRSHGSDPTAQIPWLRSHGSDPTATIFIAPYFSAATIQGRHLIKKYGISLEYSGDFLTKSFRYYVPFDVASTLILMKTF